MLNMRADNQRFRLRAHLFSRLCIPIRWGSTAAIKFGIAWGLAFSFGPVAQAASVADGQTLFNNTNYVAADTDGKKTGQQRFCQGCHSVTSFPAVASNNPAAITSAIASVKQMKFVGLVIDTEDEKRSLALYIGQYKKPIPGVGTLNIAQGLNKSGTIDVYPLLDDSGNGGAAQDVDGVTPGESITVTGTTTKVGTGPRDQYRIVYTSTLDTFGDDSFNYTITNNPGGPGPQGSSGTNTITVHRIGIKSGNIRGTLGQPLTPAYSVETNGTFQTGTIITATGLPDGLSLSGSEISGTITGPPRGSSGSGPFTVTLRGKVTLPATTGTTEGVGDVEKSVLFTIDAAPNPTAPTFTLDQKVPFNSTGVPFHLGVTGGFQNSITQLSDVGGIGGTIKLPTGKGDDSVTYQPPPNRFGVATFKYRATASTIDGKAEGKSADGTVTINVSPPDAPVFTEVILEINLQFGTSQVEIDLPVKNEADNGFQNRISVPINYVGMKSKDGIVLGKGEIIQPFGPLGPSNTKIVYKPPTGIAGTDTFKYSVTTLQGIKPEKLTSDGTIKITVLPLAPTAGSATMIVPLNTPTTLDLMPFINGSGVSGINIVAAPAHGTAAVNGTRVTYSPRHNYFGSDNFSYSAFGDAGTSAPAVVTVTVVGRPDPSKDPDVIGLISAQVEAARRFSRAQILNFQGRLESLHRSAQAESDSTKKLGNKRNGLADGTNSDAPKALTNSRFVSEIGDSPIVGQVPADQTRYAINEGFSSGLIGRSLTEDVSRSVRGGFISTAFGIVQSRTFNLAGVGDIAQNAIKPPAGVGFWVGGNLGFGKRDASGDQKSLDFTTDGVSIGVDRRFSDEVILGLGFGYARDKTNVGSAGTRSRARAAVGVLYGSYQPLKLKNTFIDALIGYGELNYDTERFVEPIDDTARARRRGNLLFGSIAANYEYYPHESAAMLSPYGRLDFSVGRLKQVTETGAGQYALTYFSQSIRAAQLSLGLRAEWEHDIEYGLALPRLRIEYTRDLEGSPRASIAYADLLDGQRYSVSPTAADRNSVTLGVGSEFILRNGLNFSIEYQFQRSFDRDDSQAIRFRLAKEFGDRKKSYLQSRNALSLDATVDAAFAYDDNVTRGKDDIDMLADQSYSLNASKEFDLTDKIRVINAKGLGFFLVGSLGGEAFRRYTGLGHVSGELQALIQYPRYSPTVAIFASTAVDGYKSTLRSGYRYSTGILLQHKFTNFIGVEAQLAHNIRYGRSSVFHTTENAARVGVNYWPKGSANALSGMLYLTGGYHRGDAVSSGRATLENLDVAEVFVEDDVFTDRQFFTYRFQAKSVVANFGYIQPLGSGHLDFSWTHATTTPTSQNSIPGAGPDRYVDNQFRIAYVLRLGTTKRMAKFRGY